MSVTSFSFLSECSSFKSSVDDGSCQLSVDGSSMVLNWNVLILRLTRKMPITQRILQVYPVSFLSQHFSVDYYEHAGTVGLTCQKR